VALWQTQQEYIMKSSIWPNAYMLWKLYSVYQNMEKQSLWMVTWSHSQKMHQNNFLTRVKNGTSMKKRDTVYYKLAQAKSYNSLIIRASYHIKIYSLHSYWKLIHVCTFSTTYQKILPTISAFLPFALLP